MAKAPAFAKAFAGRWRIVEMDTWDGRPSVRSVVSLATSTSTTATTQPSSANANDFFNSLLGIAVETIFSGGTGIAASLGIGAFDHFLIDKILKGWRPDQYVEGPLRRFLNPDK